MMRLKRLSMMIVAGIVTFMVFDIGFSCFYPDIAGLKKKHPGKTAFMKYREREWLKQGKKRKITQQWVRLAQVSPYAIKAVIIAEDDKFWSHEGFDFAAIQKALGEDIRKKKLKAGGSTISQQLAKNLYLSPSKNPVRKIKEAILTWRIERDISKRRIIELYLNVAEWGDGLFGIEAASRHYYGKPAAALTAAEAARLAVVLPNPRKYNPAREGKYVARRSEAIYRIMVKRGIVIPAYESLMEEPEEKDGHAPDAGAMKTSP